MPPLSLWGMKQCTSYRNIGILRCQPVVLSTTAFKARQTTWETLRSGNYHLFWHPQFIDYALNRVPGATCIQTIVGSVKFLRACRQFAMERDATLARIGITEDLLLDLSPHRAERLITYYLHSQSLRGMKRLSMTDHAVSSQEDVYSAVRHQFFSQANSFKVGEDLGDGKYCSYGYAAFHQQFIRAAWNEIKAGFCPTPAVDRMILDGPNENEDWVESQMNEGCQTSRTLELLDFKSLLADSLREALSDPQGWDVFHGMIYHERTVSEMASTLGISVGHISDQITYPILEGLRFRLSSFYHAKDAKRIRITEFRDALTECLSETEFLSLIPRPCDLRTLPSRRH